jgi:hypothetical protein
MSLPLLPSIFQVSYWFSFDETFEVKHGRDRPLAEFNWLIQGGRVKWQHEGNGN